MSNDGGSGEGASSFALDVASLAVVENPAMRRFELALPDGLAAAWYRVDGDRLVLTHTEVPSEYGGQGIASRLAARTFELIRASGRKAVLRCPFLQGFAARHPEYSDIVDG
ncbi:GNAT family N-acetyltransferase [Sphingosinicella terrae]|uniref:GNAT family N-acetyltransferase n=1 Tax=Sphingosinicella terrae TaxID=2172047 RepID=UPI000E0CD2F1|nr:GNAT family N-acetyltransferase [Sphingosinicella terrae]